MAVPTQGTVTSTSVTLSFTSLTTTAATGGSAITSYAIQYKLSTATTYTTIASVTSPYTVTGLTPSTLYDFNVEAQNIFGYGLPSTDLTVTTLTDVPSAPTNVVTAYNPDGVSIDITWTAPATDNGAAITAYNIEFLESDNVTYAT